MSVQPIHINIIDKDSTRNISPKDYEEEIFRNLKELIEEKDDLNTSEGDGVEKNPITSKWERFKFKFLQSFQSAVKCEKETQIENFQSLMNYCTTCGKCLGLFPFMNYGAKDIQKIRCSIFSWRYLLCYIVLFGQFAAFALSFVRLIVLNATFSSISYVLFFMTNAVSSLIFIRLSRKWPDLMKLVAESKLDEYLDPYIKFKCDLATIVLVCFSLLEHLFSVVWKTIKIYQCTDDNDLLEKLSKFAFYFIFELGVPYSFGLGVFLQILIVFVIAIWNYLQLFIICISLYLTSLFDLLNEKIISREGQHLSVSYKRSLREDYNRVCRLVRAFDDAINSILFVSFGSNFFFVCSHLYNILGLNSTSNDHSISDCATQINGIISGYVNLIYFSYSVTYVIVRSFTTMFLASKIHTASLAAVPSLYSIPLSTQCVEVQRFLEQIHGNKVALTGLNLFYVTKEFILTAIGNIVTYELILLQFSRDGNLQHPF